MDRFSSFYASMIRHLLITLSLLILTIYGCGSFPSGQERTRMFNATGFSIPAVMAYTTMSANLAKVSTLSASEGAAKKFIENLVMRSVEDVLEEQGRNAGLADILISAILQQLTVQITYEPLKCDDVYTVATTAGPTAKDNGCFIIMNTVNNNLCMAADCQLEPAPMKVKPVPSKHLSVSGTLTTSNIIMANWSTQMWQSVLNRMARSLSSGPFRDNFGTVDIRLVM